MFIEDLKMLGMVTFESMARYLCKIGNRHYYMRLDVKAFLYASGKVILTWQSQQSLPKARFVRFQGYKGKSEILGRDDVC